MKTNLLIGRDNPDTLGEWAHSLRPDFLGRVAGGRWLCVLTWVDEHETPGQDGFKWALGYGLDAKTARDIAIANIVEQRLTSAIWELTV